MKKLIVSLFVLGFLFAGTASAQAIMGNLQNTGTTTQLVLDANTNNALQNIYKSQNVGSQNLLDCAKIADEQFEKLGDAYMEAVHPGQVHTYMEQMMGGEGSSTLRQAHINMGRAYLGCWSNYNATPLTMPMMGGFGMMFNAPQTAGEQGFGMMGRNSDPGWNMMGGWYGGFNWFGWITAALVWVLLGLGIAGTVKWLRKK